MPQNKDCDGRVLLFCCHCPQVKETLHDKDLFAIISSAPVNFRGHSWVEAVADI